MTAIVMTEAKVWAGAADDSLGLPLTSENEITGVAAATLEDAVETPETTTFGNASRRHVPGLRAATSSIEVVLDTGSSGNYASLKGLFGVRRQWVFSPYGKGGPGDAFTATAPGYSFNGYLTTRPQLSGSVGDVHRQTLNITVDGEVAKHDSGVI